MRLPLSEIRDRQPKEFGQLFPQRGSWGMDTALNTADLRRGHGNACGFAAFGELPHRESLLQAPAPEIRLRFVVW